MNNDQDRDGKDDSPTQGLSLGVKQSNCKTKEENDDEIAITDTLDELDAAIDQMQKEEQDMDVDSGNQASNENSENENPDALSLPSHMAPSNNIDQK